MRGSVLCESETAVTCWNDDGRSWPMSVVLLTQHGSTAGQLMASYSSDEDPALAPVIVFLHGGAFVVGSCEASLYGNKHK